MSAGDDTLEVTSEIVGVSDKPWSHRPWKIASHRAGDDAEGSAVYHIGLYRHNDQVGQEIKGEVLSELLIKSGKQLATACDLDYLLHHPHLIPEAWKNRRIFFWGTIYSQSGARHIRFLYWDDGMQKWVNEFAWLERPFAADDFAAVVME